jgi:hypothetical protein
MPAASRSRACASDRPMSWLPHSHASPISIVPTAMAGSARWWQAAPDDGLPFPQKAIDELDEILLGRKQNAA